MFDRHVRYWGAGVIGLLLMAALQAWVSPSGHDVGFGSYAVVPSFFGSGLFLLIFMFFGAGAFAVPGIFYIGVLLVGRRAATDDTLLKAGTLVLALMSMIYFGVRAAMDRFPPYGYFWSSLLGLLLIAATVRLVSHSRGPGVALFALVLSNWVFSVAFPA